MGGSSANDLPLWVAGRDDPMEEINMLCFFEYRAYEVAQDVLHPQ